MAPSLCYGGLELSLINLLNKIDYNKYSVDLYLFQEGEALLGRLNKNVKVLEKNKDIYCFYDLKVLKSLKELLKRKKIKLFFYRIVFAFEYLCYKIGRKKYYRNTNLDWLFRRATYTKFDNKYDIAISYSEGFCNYYIVDYIDSHVKIGWYHTDYNETHPNKSLDGKFFKRLDYLNCVSNTSREAIIREFPYLKDKVKVIPNILDTDRINTLKQEEPIGFVDDNLFKIVSVGRLVDLKGFDICIEAVKILKEKGISVHLYIVGDGQKRDDLSSLIKDFHIEDNVTLLGMQDNPYKYIYNGDICVQMSSYEGRSVVIEEEKYLCKPIIVSDIPSFSEQIENNINGIIVKRNSKALSEAIEHIINNKDLYNTITGNLKKENTNSDTLELLYNEFEK